MKKYDKILNEDRERIIESYLDGKTASEISSIMRRNRSTVRSIIEKYQEGKDVHRKLKGGLRRKSLSASDTDQLQSWIEDDCTITLAQLKRKFEEELSIQVGKSTLARYIFNFNFTWKRTSLIPIRRNDQDTIEARALYANSFMNVVSSVDDSKLFLLMK